MEIIVEGKGRKSYVPTRILLNISFSLKENTYEKAVEVGAKNVFDFFTLMENLKFDKQDIKTQNFSVREDSVYNEKIKKYVKDGFIFNQNVSISFDYDMNRLSTFMERTSKLKNPPTYRINFSVKENKIIEKEILDLAFQDAKFQAECIASSNGKTISDCVKVSFEPINHSFNSPTRFSECETRVMAKSCNNSVSENIMNTFVPEDITISTTLYCVWSAK